MRGVQEITCYGVVCRGEVLTQFSRHGRTESDVCQKGSNSIALDRSRKKQRCANILLSGRDVKQPCVCLCVCACVRACVHVCV